MHKKIFLVIAYILPLIFIAVVLSMYIIQPGYKTNMWLSGCMPLTNQGSAFANNDNSYIHSFLGNPYDNYALYKANANLDKSKVDQTNFNSWINDASFYGNESNYKYCVNDSYDIYSGLKDQGEMQIVLSTKKYSLNNVKVSLVNESGLNKAGISVEYGFLRFIYASHNTGWGNAINPYGVNIPMFAPDAITNRHVQPFMASYHVYPVWVNIRTNDVVKAKDIKVKFKVTGIADTGDAFTIDGQYADVHISNTKFVSSNKNSTINFFQSPFWIQNYYDGGVIPKDVDDIYGINKYINYNKPLWNSDFKYLHNNLNQDYFTMFISQGKYLDHWHSLWNQSGMNVGNLEYNSFSPWTIGTDGTMNTNFSGFDNFANYMTNMGYSRMFLRGFKESKYKVKDSLTNYVYDERSKKEYPIDMSPLTAEGLKNNKIILNKLLQHVNDNWQNKEESWMHNSKIQIYLYLDEENEPSFYAYEDLINDFNSHCLAGNGHFLKLAVSTNGYKALLDDSIYQKIDIVYFYYSSMYNGYNSNLKKLIANRKALGLATGQYSLISDHTFNLVRSEPGVNDFIILTLCKFGITDYMRYAYDEWNKNSYFSADYDSGNVDVSGDVYFGYPSEPLGMKMPSDSQLSVDPSVRMTMLSDGMRKWDKIKYLLNNKIIDQHQYDDMMQYADEIYESGARSSSNKFNLNFKKINLANINHKIEKSYIARYLYDFSYDKVDATKTISSIIDEFIAKLE